MPGSPNPSVARALRWASLALALLGVVAVVTRADSPGTSLAVRGSASEAADVSTTVPPETSTTTTSVVEQTTTTTTVANPPTTTIPAPTTTTVPVCGPRPTPLASGPGDKLARFWIQNTSAVAGGSVWVGRNDDPLPGEVDPSHGFAPCATEGPFTTIPQVVVSSGQYGSDSLSVDQGECGWGDNLFDLVPDHQYVVVVRDEPGIDPAACGVSDPPIMLLRARIFDLVTGEELQLR